MEQSKQIITYFLMRIETIRIDTIQFVWWIVNNKMNVCQNIKKGIIKKKKIQKRKTKNKLESYNTKQKETKEKEKGKNAQK